jgi:hypothetical protein
MPKPCRRAIAAANPFGVALHCSKGLAGAPDEAITAAKDAAMHPAVAEAFALVISGANGEPAILAFQGMNRTWRTRRLRRRP